MWASNSRDSHSRTCCILGMRSGDLDSSRDAGITSFRLPATAQMHAATEAAERGFLERTGNIVSIHQLVNQFTFPTGTHQGSQWTVDGKSTFAKYMHS